MNPLEHPDHSRLLSVVILNYNRPDALAKCLDSVLEQDYGRFEILVVDNHSEEDIDGVVESRGRSVRLIKLPENLGACGGRNAGIREARGSILVMLDNDVILSSPFELSKIVKTFHEQPAVHVLAFQICDAGTGRPRAREWCHPRDLKKFAESEFETNFFGEGASAFRRDVFESAGLYWEPLFIGCEGHELALRILDRGFRVMYCPRIRVWHLMSPQTRTSERPFYYYTRNYIWISYKDYRFADGLRFVVPKLAMMLFFSVRKGFVGAYFKGIREGLAGLRRIRPERTPIGKLTVRYFAGLERTRPSILARWVRHKLEPQI